MQYFVYILLCQDGSLYTGITNDLAHRYHMHVVGRGGHYTRSHKPTRLVYQEELPDKGTALRREVEVKKLTHEQKKSLIQYTNDKQDGEQIPSITR